MFAQTSLLNLNSDQEIFVRFCLVCLVILYVVLQLLAVALLKGQWKALALPGLLAPLTVMMLFWSSGHWSSTARLVIISIFCFAGIYLLILNGYLVIAGISRVVSQSDNIRQDA